MKLYLTATSERGKPATKGGQKYLDIIIKNELQEIMWHVHIESFTEPRAMLEVFSEPAKTIRLYHEYKKSV